MKKKVLILSIAIIIVIILILFAIGKKNKNVSNNDLEQLTENSVIGSWKNNDLGADYIYTFNDDGTGNYNAAGTIMEFTYSIKENIISILYKEDTVSFDTEYKIDGDTLNIIDSFGSDTLYKKMK